MMIQCHLKFLFFLNFFVKTIAVQALISEVPPKVTFVRVNLEFPMATVGKKMNHNGA